MNAPKTPDAVLQLDAELVPCDTIIPSDTHIQQLRRKRFSQEGILELAASIGTSGVINPILVRPFASTARAGSVTPTPKYELVAGERRWLASKRAGLAHIPCVIRALDDAQVLEAQLIENKQRDDYTPLEEAEGYHELHQLKGYDAGKIGELIGKSKSYVYARMKLMQLCPEGRAALADHKIDYSKALLLARFSPALQPKALAVVSQETWEHDPISYKRAFEELREKFMKPLGSAPFTQDDDGLVEARKVGGKRGSELTGIPLPACVTCPNNSANDPELQQDVKSDAHVCTNTECFELKVVAFHERRRKQLDEANVPIVGGDDAKKIIPRKDKIVGFVDLDDVCHEDQYDELRPAAKAGESDEEFEKRESEWYDREEAYQQRTYRALLGGLRPDSVTLVEDPKSKKVRELVPVKIARDLLAKKHEIKLPGHVGKPEPAWAQGGGFDHAAWQQKQDEQRKRQEREAEYRLAVVKAIAEKCAGPLTREDLVDVADALAEDWSTKNGLKDAYGKAPEPGQLKDADLGKFIRLALIVGCIHSDSPGPILTMAKRYKVDADKIKRELAATRKAKEEPKAKADAPPAPKKAPAKKSAKKKPASKK